MKKVTLLFSLVFVAILIQSCGQVKPKETKKAVFGLSQYKVEISVDISATIDPIIYIWAEEVDYSANEKKLVIKNGYLSSANTYVSAATFLKEVTFEFPFPTFVTIEKLASEQKI